MMTSKLSLSDRLLFPQIHEQQSSTIVKRKGPQKYRKTTINAVMSEVNEKTKSRVRSEMFLVATTILIHPSELAEQSTLAYKLPVEATFTRESLSPRSQAKLPFPPVVPVEFPAMVRVVFSAVPPFLSRAVVPVVSAAVVPPFPSPAVFPPIPFSAVVLATLLPGPCGAKRSNVAVPPLTRQRIRKSDTKAPTIMSRMA